LIGAKLRMDGIITVVDVKHVLEHLDVTPATGIVNEVQQQIAFADKIILNKTDLVSTEDVALVRSRVHAINKLVEIIPTQHTKVDLNRILNIRAFDLDKITEVDPDFLKHLDDDEEDDHDHEDEHDHDHDHKHGEKKHKHEHKEGEHHKKEGEHHKKEGEHKKKEKEHDEIPKSKPKRVPRHHHASLVTSFGFVLEGQFDMGQFNAWMGQLLREKGKDIYRMKGVLAMSGMPQRFVFQAVHMVFDGNQGSMWEKDEKKINKLIFIGVNLNKEQLEVGLKSCLSDASS